MVPASRSKKNKLGKPKTSKSDPNHTSIHDQVGVRMGLMFRLNFLFLDDVNIREKH